MSAIDKAASSAFDIVFGWYRADLVRDADSSRMFSNLKKRHFRGLLDTTFARFVFIRFLQASACHCGLCAERDPLPVSMKTRN